MKTKLLSLFCLSFFLLQPSIATVRGGDTVHCVEDSETKFAGHYALDYLLTLREKTGNKDIVPVENWEESKARIMNQLVKKVPMLAHRLERFLFYMKNFEDYTQPRLWREVPFGLVDIKDEKIIRKLPKNCYSRKDNKIRIIQSVLRNQKPGMLVYEFDAKIYETLEEDRPLQFSFLMIHEWLWDIVDDVRVIREVNRLLHSNQLEQLDAKGLRLSLERVGIDFYKLAKKFMPVCERSKKLFKQMEVFLDLKCHKIDRETLANYAPIAVFWGLGMESLIPGDLSGLTRSEHFVISQNKIRKLFPYTFAGLQQVRTVSFSNNRIEAIPDRFFREQTRLSEVKFDHNKIKTVNKLFLKNHKLEKLDLSHNEIEVLPNTSLINLKEIGIFNLSHNKLGYYPSNLLHKVQPQPRCSQYGNCGIDLSHNKIKSLSQTFWGSIGKIHTINLSHNQIAAIPNDFFYHYATRAIKHIDFSHNKISNYPQGIKTVQRLIKGTQVLDLSHNQFRKLNLLLLCHNRSYTTLHIKLEGNPFTEAYKKQIRYYVDGYNKNHKHLKKYCRVTL